MATYLTEYATTVTPIENADTNDGGTTKLVHSDIDKILSGASSKTGDSADAVKYSTLETSDITPANFDAYFNAAGAQAGFFFLKILSAASTGTPDVLITFDNSNWHIKLSGVGDFCLFPMNSVDIKNTFTNHFKIKSSAADTIANVEILTVDL